MVTIPLAAGCSASAGQGDGSGTVTHANASASSFCEGYCSRVSSCDQGHDEQTCTDSCTNQNAATFPKLRSDVVDLISKCIDGKDCKTVLSSDVVGTCAAEAAASVAPSQAAIDFCDAYVAGEKKCDGSSADKAACLTRAKLFNDTALGKAKDCTKKGCSDIAACVDAALGAVTDGSHGGGGTDDAGTSTNDGGKTDGGSSHDGGGTSTCSALAGDTSACGQCGSTYCCGEWTACMADTYCGGLVSCLQTCPAGDTTCQNNCYSSYPSGTSLLGQVQSCMQSSCSGTCQQP